MWGLALMAAVCALVVLACLCRSLYDCLGSCCSCWLMCSNRQEAAKRSGDESEDVEVPGCCLPAKKKQETKTFTVHASSSPRPTRPGLVRPPTTEGGSTDDLTAVRLQVGLVV